MILVNPIYHVVFYLYSVLDYIFSGLVLEIEAAVHFGYHVHVVKLKKKTSLHVLHGS